MQHFSLFIVQSFATVSYNCICDSPYLVKA